MQHDVRLPLGGGLGNRGEGIGLGIVARLHRIVRRLDPAAGVADDDDPLDRLGLHRNRPAMDRHILRRGRNHGIADRGWEALGLVSSGLDAVGRNGAVPAATRTCISTTVRRRTSRAILDLGHHPRNPLPVRPQQHIGRDGRDGRGQGFGDRRKRKEKKDSGPGQQLRHRLLPQTPKP